MIQGNIEVKVPQGWTLHPPDADAPDSCSVWVAPEASEVLVVVSRSESFVDLMPEVAELGEELCGILADEVLPWQADWEEEEPPAKYVVVVGSGAFMEEQEHGPATGVLVEASAGALFVALFTAEDDGEPAETELCPTTRLLSWISAAGRPIANEDDGAW